MNEFLETYQEAFSYIKPIVFILFNIFVFSTIIKMFFNIIGSDFSLFDILSELKECIFYRDKFTCKSEKCSVPNDEIDIDVDDFKCNENCKHYGKCVNCMFFDYDEDKYICGKCYHRYERRELKPLEDFENE